MTLVLQLRITLIKKFKPNFFISFISFYYYNKKDQHRLYNVLLNLSILFRLLYLSNIIKNTFLFKSKYIYMLIVSSYNISRSNLAINVNKICKKVIIRVIALVGRL